MIAVVAFVMILVVWRFFVVFGAAVFEGVGLSPGSAGFESRSALVGAGYTTSQSEAVVRHPVTRRVAAILIVFGYFGPPALIALLGATFVIPTDEDLGDRLIALVVLLALFVASDALGVFRAIATRPARAMARRMWGSTTVETWITVGDHVVAELTVPFDETRAAATLTSLATDDVRTLAIDRGKPNGATYPDDGRPAGAGPGDRLVIFGPGPLVDSLRADA